MIRLFMAILMSFMLSLPVSAQEPTADRSATGGAQTLSDIIARQKGEAVQDDFRRNATGDTSIAADLQQQLGTLGG